MRLPTLVVVFCLLGQEVMAQPVFPPVVGVQMHGRHWSFSWHHSPAFYGWGTPWGYSQAVIIHQPMVMVQPRQPRLSDPEPIRPAAVVGDQGKLQAAVKRGELLVIQPQKMDLLPGVEVVPPVRIPRVMIEEELAPRDLAQRAIFEVKRAKQAFIAEQYGLAVERLQSAIEANPKEALPWFLLAQVQTARGKYLEAVQAIASGLKLDPDWPAKPFQLATIYEGQEPQFQQHFQKLKQAQTREPDEPLLQFLLAYHDWFLGDRAEAKKLFKKVSAAVNQAELIERFLEEKEG